MLKKMGALIIVSILSIGMVACSGEKKDKEKEDNKTTTERSKTDKTKEDNKTTTEQSKTDKTKEDNKTTTE
ncbi:hypothetical protein IKG_05846, partial [Bacillus cereus VD200]